MEKQCSLGFEKKCTYSKTVCYKVYLCEYCQQLSCRLRHSLAYLSIRAKKVRGGRPLLRENLAETDPLSSKMPISNQYSLVAPQSVSALSSMYVMQMPRPYSGTHCGWMSSHPLHFRSSASVWRLSSSTNHFLMLYDRQTTLSWT